MRKLIEIEQEDIVICDTPSCDFKIPNETRDAAHKISNYLDVPCPKCGENLLTKADLDMYVILLNKINWINRWFSWLTIFSFRKRKGVSVHCYNGITVKEKVV